ncbi:MAG: hypothetical protein ACI3ZK_03460 [Candidatus Cryptobacteroides sp.]
MLTLILSAVCAFALGVNTIASQTDTTNVYIINGEKVENFDGSQLVGKTISDYKTIFSSSTSNEETSVTIMHVISTDGKTMKKASHYSTITNGEISKNSIVGLDGEYSLADIQVKERAKDIETYIDGKKSTMADLGKILPEKIASMTIYRAGSPEAAKYTDSEDKNVIVVELKK